MQRHIARLTELRATDGQDAVCEIDIIAIELQRFTASHTGRRIQAEEGGIGVRPQAGYGRKLPRCIEQAGNLFVAVDVRGRTLVTIGQQVGRRDGGPRVDGAAILREASNCSQATGPFGGLHGGRLGRPRQGQLGRDVAHACVIGEHNEALQQPSGVT